MTASGRGRHSGRQSQLGGLIPLEAPDCLIARTRPRFGPWDDPTTVELPSHPTRFVWRAEVAERNPLLDTKQQPRLLTTTGPAGCGSTRLATQLATPKAAELPGAVTGISLAGLVDVITSNRVKDGLPFAPQALREPAEGLIGIPEQAGCDCTAVQLWSMNESGRSGHLHLVTAP